MKILIGNSNKIISALIALLLILVLVGCGDLPRVEETSSDAIEIDSAQADSASLDSLKI